SFPGQLKINEGCTISFIHDAWSCIMWSNLIQIQKESLVLSEIHELKAMIRDQIGYIPLLGMKFFLLTPIGVAFLVYMTEIINISTDKTLEMIKPLDNWTVFRLVTYMPFSKHSRAISRFLQKLSQGVFISTHSRVSVLAGRY